MKKRRPAAHRKGHENECDAELIKRHSQFANWGKLLFDTVNHFGLEVKK